MSGGQSGQSDGPEPERAAYPLPCTDDPPEAWSFLWRPYAGKLQRVTKIAHARATELPTKSCYVYVYYGIHYTDDLSLRPRDGFPPVATRGFRCFPLQRCRENRAPPQTVQVDGRLLKISAGPKHRVWFQAGSPEEAGTWRDEILRRTAPVRSVYEAAQKYADNLGADFDRTVYVGIAHQGAQKAMSNIASAWNVTVKPELVTSICQMTSLAASSADAFNWSTAAGPIAGLVLSAALVVAKTMTSLSQLAAFRGKRDDFESLLHQVLPTVLKGIRGDGTGLGGALMLAVDQLVQTLESLTYLQIHLEQAWTRRALETLKHGDVITELDQKLEKCSDELRLSLQLFSQLTIETLQAKFETLAAKQDLEESFVTAEIRFSDKMRACLLSEHSRFLQEMLNEQASFFDRLMGECSQIMAMTTRSAIADKTAQDQSSQVVALVSEISEEIAPMIANEGNETLHLTIRNAVEVGYTFLDDLRSETYALQGRRDVHFYKTHSKLQHALQCARNRKIEATDEGPQTTIIPTPPRDWWILDRAHYCEPYKKLGYGASATVYRASFQKQSKVAVKRFNDGGDAKIFRREFEIMTRLRHPRIVQAIGGWLDSESCMTHLLSNPCLVMEFMAGGDLEAALSNHLISTTDDKIRVLRDVADGLQFLHLSDVVHRDLKPANILISEDKRAKISDFGHSKFLEELSTSRTQSGVVGTIAYMPPEFLVSGENKDRAAIRAADVWSLGVVAWRLFSEQSPSNVNGRLETGSNLKNAIVTGERELPTELLKCREDLKELITQCLSKNFHDRPTSSNVFARLDAIINASSLENGTGHTSGSFIEERRVSTGETPETRIEVGASSLDKDEQGISEEERVKRVTELATTGKDANCLVELGLRFQYGRGVELDRQAALSWFFDAVKLGIWDGAMYIRDMLKANPSDSEIQTTAADRARLLVDMATPADPLSQVRAGLVLYWGSGVLENDSRAEQLFRAASDRDVPEGQLALGHCLESHDPQAAVELCRKAAEQGNARAQFNLGWSLKNGDGVAQDKEAGVQWFRKAAELGNARAQVNFGICLKNGDGVVQDRETAVQWFRKAAEQGYATAQFNLGWCLKNGDGVVQDREKAVQWFRRAAEQGNATAQFNFGCCLDNGDGVVQDKAAAVQLYRKAAEHGNATAQCKLGCCLKNGNGVAQDKAEAVQWFRKAAEQGNADGQFNLGLCLKNGDGVVQDREAALQWYRKAAEQGNAAAQYNLGWCVKNANGVAQDKAAAVQ